MPQYLLQMGLDVFEKMSRDIALVVTDMVMPRMDGKERMNVLLNRQTTVSTIGKFKKAYRAVTHLLK